MVFKLLSYLALSIPIISCYKLRYGIALCLLFEILVPPVFNLKLIGLPFNIRYIYILLLLIVVIKLRLKRKKLDYKIFKPYLILFVPLTIIMFFQTATPLSIQFSSITRVVMVTFLLPVIIWNANRIDKGSINYIIKIYCIYVLIACIYGLFLTQSLGINPYLILLYDTYSNKPFNVEYAAALGEGRLFGRIQSTFVHPMTWALFLCFAFILNYTFYNKEKKNIRYILLLIIISANLLICGVRTGIVVTIICFIIDLVRKKKIKVLILLSVSIFIIASFTIANNEEVQNYLMSIIDFSGNKSQVSGSSFGMRINQLLGCFSIISDSPIFGNGYGWHSYYMSINGDHPIVLAFESILFVIICNSGFLGLLIYFYFFYNIIRRPIIKIDNDGKYYLQMLTFSYIGFSLITGEYDYLQQFAIYHSLLLCYFYNYNKPIKNQT